MKWKHISRTVFLITAVLAVLQIAQLLRSCSGPSVAIQAKAVIVSPELPTDVLDEISQEYDLLSRFEVSQKELYLPENIKPELKEEYLSIAQDGARQAIRYAQEHFPVNLRERLFEIRSIVKFTIRNTGTLEVTGLVLELPLDGTYRIEKSDGINRTGSFNKRIDLGGMRPKNDIIVTVWLRNYFSSYYENDTRITHPSGVVDIDYPVVVWGPLAWCIENGFILLMGFWIVLSVILMIMHLWSDAMRRTS